MVQPPVARATSALGQEVGKLFESAVLEAVRGEVESRGYAIRPARLRNGTGNVYQIDAVVFDGAGNPIIIIDPKYIRYTKHNRDKGSWLCVAHYNLRKTHRTIRKSLAVLAGRWSATSRAMIGSFGVEILEVKFDDMAEAFRNHGIQIEWPERGGEPIARASLADFNKLDDGAKYRIGQEVVSGISARLREEVAQTLDTGPDTIASRVAQVEVLLKTSQGEMVLSSFESVPAAMRALTDLVSDKPDITAFIADSGGNDGNSRGG